MAKLTCKWRFGPLSFENVEAGNIFGIAGIEHYDVFGPVKRQELDDLVIQVAVRIN